MYLTISCPDIAYAVHKLSQYMSSPRVPHLNALHHLLRYLKTNPGQGLFFSATSSLSLKGYADADWGNCIDTRRSTTGFCVFLGTSLVSWKSKRQATVSRSSAEAEYRSLAAVASEITWMVTLLRDFEVVVESALVFCDNQSAIHLSTNPTFHERSKHIEIDCHFIREKVNSGLIRLVHVKTQHQLADILTKPVTATQFQNLMSKMGVLDIYRPS